MTKDEEAQVLKQYFTELARKRGKIGGRSKSPKKQKAARQNLAIARAAKGKAK